MSTSSGKAKSLCSSLGKPSDASAKVLATLFPACASLSTKQALKFDPSDDCVVSEAHHRKKAGTPRKGRAKRLKVVILKDIPSSIPKGSRRESLRKDGWVAEIPFHRCMTSAEVMKHVQACFNGLGDVSNLQFLHARQDNTLQVAGDQKLDGVGVIKLAGCGSLYMKQSDSVLARADVEPRDSSSSNTSISSKPSSSTTETKQLLERADKVLQMLRVSDSCTKM